MVIVCTGPGATISGLVHKGYHLYHIPPQATSGGGVACAASFMMTSQGYTW